MVPLHYIADLADRRGPWLIGGVAAITLAMGCAIPGLGISSSLRDLMPANTPELQEYDAFLDEFGASTDFIAVLESKADEKGSETTIRRASDALAARLTAAGSPVDDVFHRFDTEALVARLPLFLETEELAALLERGAEASGVLEAFAGAEGLPQLLDRFTSLIENGGAAAGGTDTAAQTLELLAWFFQHWQHRLEQPGEQADSAGPAAQLPDLPGLETKSDRAQRALDFFRNDGYLGSEDGHLVFLFVRLDRSTDDPAYYGEADALIRQAWRETVAAEPAFEKVAMGLTGMPAQILTETRGLRTDLLRAGIPSAAMVVLVLSIGLRSFRRTLVAALPLACGMVISLGALRFVFGELNRMSVAFLAIMFGIGIDFAIYLVRRSDEERAEGAGRRDAVRRAVAASGRGIVAGGAATALAFSVMGFSAFRGTSQLGLTTALAILIVLAVTLLLLPPLLMRIPAKWLPPPRMKITDSEALHAVEAAKAAERTGKAGTGKAKTEKAVPKPWYAGFSRPVNNALLAAFAGLAVFGGMVAARIPVDYSSLSVMPRDAESTEFQLKMQDRSDFQMTAAIIHADDAPTLRTNVERVRALPTVARVVTLDDVIPGEQEAKRELLARHGEVFAFAESFDWPKIADGKIDPEALEHSLARLANALLDAQDAAFSAGQTALLPPLQSAIDSVEALRNFFVEQPGAAAEGTRVLAEEWQTGLDQLAAHVGSWRQPEPLAEDDLPAGFVSRFRSPGGKRAAFVYPSGSIWDREFLTRFLGEIRGVTPRVTGFPVINEQNTLLLAKGIFQSLILTAVVVVILLALDFRSPVKVLYALLPLAAGMGLLQAFLFATGQEYNLASINALPLLLGLGVVYGVHLVHRWSEHPEASAFLAVKTSGRAIALAGITTMSGTASLTLCLHRGIATFGALLLQGIVCMLLAALVALPLAIDWSQRVFGRGKSD